MIDKSINFIIDFYRFNKSETQLFSFIRDKWLDCSYYSWGGGGYSYRNNVRKHTHYDSRPSTLESFEGRLQKHVPFIPIKNKKQIFQLKCNL